MTTYFFPLFLATENVILWKFQLYLVLGRGGWGSVVISYLVQNPRAFLSPDSRPKDQEIAPLPMLAYNGFILSLYFWPLRSSYSVFSSAIT